MQFFYKRSFFLLLFVSLMITDAWGAETQTYYFKAKAIADPTGAGKVYVSATETSNPSYSSSYEAEQNSENASSAPQKTFYFYSKANDGYSFLNWTNSSGSVVSTSPNCYINLTGDTSSDSQTFTANFVERGVVKLLVDGIGTATISNVQNQLGETVTLTATVDNIFFYDFLGWTKDDETEYCSTATTLTVIATENVTYIAHFKKRNGLYCRAYVSSTGNYLQVRGDNFNTAQNDPKGIHFTNSIACYSSTATIDGKQKYLSDPGTVIYVKGDINNEGLDNAELHAQGISTKKIIEDNWTGAASLVMSKSIWIDKSGEYYRIYGYALSNNRYMRDATVVAKTYPAVSTIQGQTREGYGTVDGSATVVYPTILHGGTGQHLFTIQPISEKTMDQYYFGAAPKDDNFYTNANNDSYYYTTMYTAFPFKCYDGVKAYVVDQIAGNKIHCKEIESGEVPTKTPVILQCKGTTAFENRLVPMLTDPASITGTNLLKGVIDIDNNTAAYGTTNYTFNYRTKYEPSSMRVFGAEGIGPKFSTTNTEETYITSNTAYLNYSGSATELQLLFDIESKAGCYRLKNKEGGYLSVADDGELAVVTDANQIGTVLSMNLTPSSDQTYYSATKLSAQGKDFSDILGGSVKVGNINANLDIVSLYTENGDTKNYVETDGTIGTTEAEWTLVPVEEPLTLNATKVTYDKSTAEEKYVTTLYTDFPYSVGDGFSAFVVPSASEKNGVVLTDIGADVPANTGVVIAKSPASDDTGSFGIMPVYGADVDLESNLLKGTCLPMAYDPNTMYVLGRDNAGVVGFRTYTGTTVTANKAYLEMSGAGVKTNFMRFNFEDDDTPTAIILSEKEKMESDSAWYTVTGLRLSGTPKSKGIYIHNGKKIMIK